MSDNLKAIIIVIGIVMAAIGLVIVYFFAKYNGTAIVRADLYLAIGFAMLLIGAGAIYFLTKIKGNRTNNNTHSELRNNTSGTVKKIPVDLGKCEIVSSKHYEEEELYSGANAFAHMAIHYTDSENVLRNEINQSRIIFHHQLNGDKMAFASEIINKDKETLAFLLAMKKTTFLYLDTENKYYDFDLDFLSS